MVCVLYVGIFIFFCIFYLTTQTTLVIFVIKMRVKTNNKKGEGVMSYCQKENDRYNCKECAFVNYNRDCHNNSIVAELGDCDNCGQPADQCNCGDYINTAPLTEAEKAWAAEEAEKNKPTKEEINAFFGE